MRVQNKFDYNLCEFFPKKKKWILSNQNEPVLKESIKLVLSNIH